MSSRLYISPLTSTLLPSLLPPDILPLADSITYHTIASDPQKSFGYLTLPTSIAERLRKKLHASFVKGLKIRVEEARPDMGKRKHAQEVADAQVAAPVPTRDAKPKKVKREDRVVRGVELPADRKVVRGWSEKKNGATLDGAQMLFRTKIPDNKATLEEGNGLAVGAREKKRKRGNEATVKEFDKSTKFPTFLKTAAPDPNAKRAAEFVEGKGWVDEQGDVVEDSKTRSSREITSAEPILSRQSSSEESSVVSSSSDEEPDEAQASTKHSTPSHSPPPKDSTPTITVTDAPVAEHEPSQLETLFKRPAPAKTKKSSLKPNTSRPAPIHTGFSFFASTDADGNDDDLDDEAAPDRYALGPGMPPATPFTRRDLETRGVRSAAPTPDTAAIAKFRAPWRGRSASRSLSVGMEEDDGDVIPSGETASMEDAQTEDVDAAAQEGESSEFSKRFYAERGNLNRDWKAKLRNGRKESRQVENRREGKGRGGK